MPLALPGYHTTETLFQSPVTQVHRAIRESDNTPVVLRFCCDSESGTSLIQGQCTRLTYSREILALFDHENIVKVIDWNDSLATPCLVMEDIRGIDLARYTQRYNLKQLPLELFLDIALQLSNALAVIHHAQVIHKDLHPGNMIINPDSGRVQIIDFGLASLLSREEPTVASTENREGNLSYLSPEQTGRMNRALDYRTDFYTLGVTFYQLLTGELPFFADDALGLVYAHIAQLQRPVHERRKEVPVVLSAIVDKLLNKNAEDRYISALGLAHDLQQCKTQLAEKGTISGFRLGEQDISDRFQLPQTLYGREKDVTSLMHQFAETVKGKPHLLAISGHSGIGKSALVHEIHKPIAANKGLFICGKFDQFQQNTPYSALTSALSGWVNQTLSLPEDERATLRKQLLKLLGANARLLIDFMPEFEWILGSLPLVPDLAAQETQARFSYVFASFIQYATQTQPWAIFIDDIQWADRGTLNLLPELLDASDSKLLIIVAYRENEVTDLHPVMQMLQRLHQMSSDSQRSFSQLHLGPLQSHHIQQLLVDALHRTAEDASELATLVLNKTGGNPFFTMEFLKTLYQRALLNFDLNAKDWRWNLAEIEKESITENVVELMLSKMKHLPQETQKLMQLAACVGTKFDLQTLAIISDTPASEIEKLIWPALKAGLLVQERGDAIQGKKEAVRAQPHRTSKQVHLVENFAIPVCRFLHDRMLQAAYESLPINYRQQTHLKIGRRLYAHSTEKQRESLAFELVEQLNHGTHLMTDACEKSTLADLNLLAAQKAKHASVWTVASRYAAIGKKLLLASPWETDHERCYILTTIQAECDYLTGKSRNAETLYDELLANTKSDIDKAQQCAQRVAHYVGRADYDKALNIGIKGLAFLDISMPTDEPKLQALLDNQESRLSHAFAKTPLTKMSELPDLNDRRTETAIYLMSELGVSAMLLTQRSLYFACINECLILSLEQGKCDLTAITLATYGMSLTFKEQLEQAYEAGQQALLIKNQYTNCRQAASTINGVAFATQHLKDKPDNIIRLFRQGFDEGMQSGEITRAGVCLAAPLMLMLIDGTRLQKMHDYALKALEFGRQKSLKLLLAYLSVQYTESMAENQHLLHKENFPSSVFEAIENSFFNGLLEQLQLFFFFWSDYPVEQLLQQGKKVIATYQQLSQAPFQSDNYFTLCTITLRATKSGYFDKHPKERDEWQAHFDTFLSKLKKLDTLYSPNYQDKLCLIQAEQLAQEGAPMQVVITRVQEAIKSAEENGRRHYVALGNEMLADYLQGQGFPELAEKPAEKALALYQEWGCQAKLDHLPGRFSFLANAHQMSMHSYQSSLNSSTALDFASVVKSTQAISGELAFKGLVSQVMHVIMENAGAQCGALVFNRLVDGKPTPTVEALINNQEDQCVFLQEQRLSKCKQLPVSLIENTLRTQRIINIDNVSHNGDYRQDRYFQRKQPKSVLCMPIIHRDSLMGVIYLENHITASAFTQNRLKTLNILLTQATISFENARLFNEVSNLNIGLEKKVAERTRELEQANEEMKSFSYTVSHDLRSPLRAIKSYTRVLLEDHNNEFDPAALALVKRINKGAEKMGELINGLLELSRVQYKDIDRKTISLTEMATHYIKQLEEQDADRSIRISIDEGMIVAADERMMMSVVENLLGNAWKYSSKTDNPEIVFSQQENHGEVIYCIKDNGAGFDMNYAKELFGTFKRMHSDSQFPGTGVGLATVKRIINRHGGKIWADAAVDQGASFYFTIPDKFTLSDK